AAEALPGALLARLPAAPPGAVRDRGRRADRGDERGLDRGDEGGGEAQRARRAPRRRLGVPRERDALRRDGLRGHGARERARADAQRARRAARYEGEPRLLLRGATECDRNDRRRAW